MPTEKALETLERLAKALEVANLLTVMKGDGFKNSTEAQVAAEVVADNVLKPFTEELKAKAKGKTKTDD